MNIDFQTRLIHWYQQNKRPLPWRQTADPYVVWLSEIILQQTRVDQGLDYFNRFIKKWPGVIDMAAAQPQEVLKMWQGLGYYSRARNLHATARVVVDQYDGLFPTDYNTLIKLKGIGPYTAAAISSICGDEPKAVVDGNVYRVLSRFYGISTPIDSGSGKKTFQTLATDLIRSQHPGTFNQAMMEFGALQCVPKNPDCIQCIFNTHCKAFTGNKVDKLPVKQAKRNNRNRYFNYLVIRVENGSKGIYIHHRTKNDIWRGLYDFPMIETIGPENFGSIAGTAEWKKLFDQKNWKLISSSQTYKHKLTHQHIHAVFHIIHTSAFDVLSKKNVFLVDQKQLENYPIPKLIERFLLDSKHIM